MTKKSFYRKYRIVIIVLFSILIGTAVGIMTGSHTYVGENVHFMENGMAWTNYNQEMERVFQFNYLNAIITASVIIGLLYFLDKRRKRTE